MTGWPGPRTKGFRRENPREAHSSRSAAMVAAGFGRPPLGSLEDVGKATRAKVEDERNPLKTRPKVCVEIFF